MTLKRWTLHRLVDLFTGYNRAASRLMFRVGYVRLIYKIGEMGYAPELEHTLADATTAFIDGLDRALRGVIDAGAPPRGNWDEYERRMGELLERSIDDALASVRGEARRRDRSAEN